MAHLTPDEEHTTLESQVRECYGRCAYSHKTHERMADRHAKWLGRVKMTQIVLAALTAGGALGVIFTQNGAYYAYATAALSFVSLALNSYMKDLDPGEAAQKHRETAADLWNIRESYLSLLTDIRSQCVPLEGLRERRDKLQDQLHQIYRTAPHTDGKAYVEAQDRLKNKEDLTFSDTEIDAMLPTTLKRSD
ncbi:SLATT domain-containing protein [Bradyrhizobium sp. CB2312]|uniref:SLATT domain-containing protein n=1 Tax=Bradyrhizobium sp. CB2312 TaxID=3039155 RepID=UPI0024B2685A|nr:SLATT domain-containing protein [Bradyrhizobium sp. CB2312]WFU75223.1 SLATT domain-containing protein [Bradyrhizobium sp. CB2312]